VPVAPGSWDIDPAARAARRQQFASFTVEDSKPTLPAPADARYPDINGMLRSYEREDQQQVPGGGRVQYLKDERQRQMYKVTIKNGQLLDANELPIDTMNSRSLFGTLGLALYGMDFDGTIYVATGQEGRFHHSSFLAGDALAAAGEIRIERGAVTMVNRRSGHYGPSVEQLNQFVAELHRQGVTGFEIVQAIESTPPIRDRTLWLQTTRGLRIDAVLKTFTPAAMTLARIAALERGEFRPEIAAAVMGCTVEDLSLYLKELTPVFGSDVASGNELAVSRILRQMPADQQGAMTERLRLARIAWLDRLD
jgi:hypothetical protein